MQSAEMRPIFLNDTELRALIESKPYTAVVNAFDRQLKELFFIKNHAFIGQDKSQVYASTEYTAYAQATADDYTHVYYPWNHHVVKTVTKDAYLALKTNRNQDLITADEQLILSEYRIGIFGLSVGSNVAFTLAQAGISNSIILADFDELDTTNLNRIMAGVHQVGLNKTVIAARHIYEDNPFAEVTSMTAGVDTDSLRQLLEEKRLDCMIDEVDDISFKISARKLAIEYKIPVVMVTDNGDGIVLHVERYDLGHGKIFGKDPAYFDALQGALMSREQAGQIIMKDIVGGMDRVNPEMLKSVKRTLAKELVSWSQLGSAALLGGVVATYIIKQIALHKNSDRDIRAYIAPRLAEWSSHSA